MAKKKKGLLDRLRGLKTPAASPPVVHKKDFGGYKQQNLKDYDAHAQELKKLARGKDFVERAEGPMEKRPAPFDRAELEVVRQWLRSRPLEPTPAAAAKVPYPRMWTTKRGRYAQFKLAECNFGLVRARPTF
jgi:hypothetical protein